MDTHKRDSPPKLFLLHKIPWGTYCELYRCKTFASYARE